MNIMHLLNPILNLFDGGAAAGGDGGGNAAGAIGAAGETQASSVPTRRGKFTGETHVLYGKQSGAAASKAAGGEAGAPDAGESGTSAVPTTLEERRKAYRDLMEGEYKDLYTEDTQRIINRRFRETETLRQQNEAQQPLIDLLMQRYHISDGDMGKLTRALENDEAYWSEAAEAAGMDVEHYKEFQKLQRDNEQMRRAMQQQRNQANSDAQMREWMQQADEVRGIYKSFDLEAETQNPNFIRLLKSGTDMKTAYEVLHIDDIKAGIATMQAKATEKQIVANIRAKGSRPAENGTAAQSGFTIKDDVSKLTKKDRAEIVRRIARGEQITF